MKKIMSILLLLLLAFALLPTTVIAVEPVIYRETAEATMIALDLTVTPFYTPCGNGSAMHGSRTNWIRHRYLYNIGENPNVITGEVQGAYCYHCGGYLNQERVVM